MHHCRMRRSFQLRCILRIRLLGLLRQPRSAFQWFLMQQMILWLRCIRRRLRRRSRLRQLRGWSGQSHLGWLKLHEPSCCRFLGRGRGGILIHLQGGSMSIIQRVSLL
jgi:hypothetical protein